MAFKGGKSLEMYTLSPFKPNKPKWAKYERRKVLQIKERTSMNIVYDKNQALGIHKKSNQLKHDMLTAKGHTLIECVLPFGDYTKLTPVIQETIDRRGNKLHKMDLVADIKISIDTKKDLQEVCGNICSVGHSRFKDEAILAQKAGARFIVLVEEPGIKTLKDVFGWVNPRLKRWNYMNRQHQMGYKLNIPIPSKPPTSGETLAKAMITMQEKYGIEWQFCNRMETADRIVQILSEGD